ncbi:MAG: ATP-dependent DNA helicase UvrD2 [Chloroflexota bacterium]
MAADPDAILAHLNPAQREAARAVLGPVAIHAGAGTGKTTVLTRRAAYAIATGAVRPERMLLVTFTEKAAAELVARIAALGLPRVTARTFHSAALRQLRYFLGQAGTPMPEVLDNPYQLLGPLHRRMLRTQIPRRNEWYRYTFVPLKDIVTEIGWARSRGIGPDDYETRAAGRTPPLPPELFVALMRDYAEAKRSAGVIDFDDMLWMTVDLLETDPAALAAIQGQFTWFCVDEYQDTSPVQQRLLERWLGDRHDLCVVGDEDQTIYSFSGATSRYLTGFAERHPGAVVVRLTENHRSSPEILVLANRLVAAGGHAKGLEATRPSGPAPTVTGFEDEDAELRALIAGLQRSNRAGTPWAEMAVLVRLNAQLPAIEAVLRAAEIPFRLRGQRFFDRPEIREAVGLLRRLPPDAAGEALQDAVETLLRRRLGLGEEAQGAEASERQAALGSLLEMVERLVAADPRADGAALLADLERRRKEEAEPREDGVELATLHRAKGLEWDAVFLPGLEEGSLPVSQAAGDADLIAEERRLLYVGITRARRELTLSWARERRSSKGRAATRKPSRFLADLEPPRPRPGAGRAAATSVRTAGASSAAARPAAAEGGEVFTALRAWRLERARADAKPPYVIAHDSTLLEIESRLPATEAELRRVPGMGPVKVEQYGAEILATVRAAIGQRDAAG